MFSYKVLGDDSILLKYINPNLVALVSTAAEASSSNQTDGVGIFVNLVDGVSSKVIHRMAVEDATAPVHCVVLENSVVVTYWNAKVKRTELLALSLFEGLIDKFSLGPLAKPRDNLNKPFSSFVSSTPLVQHKAFVLPYAVAGLYHTHTKAGLSNVNLLIAFQNGQLYSLDRRQINPRRPLAAPSKAEQEEGLLQYNPFVQLSPFKFLSLNYSIAEIRGIISVPSHLESTSLVFSYGMDCHFFREMPSAGFDKLAPDFNAYLLCAILCGMFFAVEFLRQASLRKSLVDSWK